MKLQIPTSVISKCVNKFKIVSKLLVLVYMLTLSTRSFAIEMVNTPFGAFPKVCVNQHPDETTFEEVNEGLKARLSDGTVNIIPRNPICKPYIDKVKAQNAVKYSMPLDSPSLPNQSSANTKNWHNLVSWTAPSEIATYTANYTVPQTPKIISSQTLFYFIGVKNDATSIQPVLSYENQRWNISSWDCCTGGSVNHSAAIYGMEPEDIINASITSDGQDKFTVTTSWYGQATRFHISPVSSKFTRANMTSDGYNMKTINELSTGERVFSDIEMVNRNNESLTPIWRYLSPDRTISDVKLTVNDNSMSIQKFLGCYDFLADPILNNESAKTICPAVCEKEHREWNGQWKTILPYLGVTHAICGCCYYLPD